MNYSHLTDLDMSSTISRILERLIYPDSEHIGALHMLLYHNSIRVANVAQNLSATNWAWAVVSRGHRDNYVCTVLQCCKNWQNRFFWFIWYYEIISKSMLLHLLPFQSSLGWVSEKALKLITWNLNVPLSYLIIIFPVFRFCFWEINLSS